MFAIVNCVSMLKPEQLCVCNCMYRYLDYDAKTTTVDQAVLFPGLQVLSQSGYYLQAGRLSSRLGILCNMVCVSNLQLVHCILLKAQHWESQNNMPVRNIWATD